MYQLVLRRPARKQSPDYSTFEPHPDELEQDIPSLAVDIRSLDIVHTAEVVNESTINISLKEPATTTEKNLKDAIKRFFSEESFYHKHVSLSDLGIQTKNGTLS